MKINNQLKPFCEKLEMEYNGTSSKIDNLKPEKQECENIENECIDGLYKQHITIYTEPKMVAFYDEYSYENLMGKYENKIDEFRKETDEIIEARSKKQLMHYEKEKIIDMLARQFASCDFTKIKLIDIAGLTRREVERLQEQAQQNIEIEAETIEPEERENLKKEHLDKLQFEIDNYWYEKDLKEKEEKDKKEKISLWQKIKQFFTRIRKKSRLLESGRE